MSRFVYGLDPASKADYFGMVVNEIPDLKGDEKNTPRLKTLRMFTRISYDEMMNILKDDLFERYPPFHIVIDYTNEKTFSDMLESNYEKKVKKISFNNANKLRLKQDGLDILRQGYKFPKKVADPEQKKLLGILIKQLQKEQILNTKSGKPTFDHPQGEHNDLAIAWELSIHGCLKWMRKVQSPYVVVSKKFGYPDRFGYLGSAIPSGAQLLSRAVYMPDGRFYSK